MLVKTLRYLFMLSFFLGACSGDATDEITRGDETVEEVVEETSDDELVEAEEATDEQAADEEAAEEAAAEEVAAEQTAEEIEALESGEVLLLDAGQEPRQELRYTLAPGTELLTLEQIQAQTQTFDGTTLPGAPPTGSVTETQITVTLDGDLAIVESEVISAVPSEGTDPELVPALEEAFVPLIGLTTIATIDSRGVVTNASTDQTGNELIDDATAAVEGVSSPFPEEAVGVGGTWQVDIAQQFLGLSITNRTTSVVREITDTGVILDITIEQISNDLGQEVDLGGIFATVDVWDSTGTGFVEVNFDQLSPVRSESRLEALQVFSIDGEGVLEQTVSADAFASSISQR